MSVMFAMSKRKKKEKNDFENVERKGLRKSHLNQLTIRTFNPT